MVYTNYIFSCLDEDLMIVGPSRSRSIDVLLTCKTFYEEAKPHLDEMRWEECIMRVGVRTTLPHNAALV